MLSDEHLTRHCIEIHERYINASDSGGGGHAGMSLNIYCGITGETPERLTTLMAQAKFTPESIESAKKKLKTSYGYSSADLDSMTPSVETLYFRPST